MRVIEYDQADEGIARRLVTALVSQWENLPKGNREDLLRDACLSIDPALPPTTSLREDVQTFIRKHGSSTVPLRK